MIPANSSPASSGLAAIGILEHRTVGGIAAPCPGTSSIWQAGSRDLIGHECSNDDEAREHGNFIAHRIGRKKPDMVREENYIVVTNETGAELFKLPVASTLTAGTLLHPRGSSPRTA
jgi:hypothetical protein